MYEPMMTVSWQGGMCTYKKSALRPYGDSARNQHQCVCYLAVPTFTGYYFSLLFADGRASGFFKTCLMVMHHQVR